MKRFSFEKKKRLVTKKEFKAVLARNLCVSNEVLTLYVAENDFGYPRLGVSVGKSCGSANVRNRLKRLLREAFRQNQDQIPTDFDYLLMISSRWPTKEDKPASRGKTLGRLTFEQIKASFLALVASAESQIKKKTDSN